MQVTADPVIIKAGTYISYQIHPQYLNEDWVELHLKQSKTYITVALTMPIDSYNSILWLG